MLCRFEFTAFLLCRLSPEFVAVLSFSGRWDECGMYGGRGFHGVTSTKPRFLLQIVEAPRWFICLHWSPGGDTFVFMLRIQQTLFHFTSYGCHIKPSLVHTSCNHYNISLSIFKSKIDNIDVFVWFHSLNVNVNNKSFLHFQLGKCWYNILLMSHALKKSLKILLFVFKASSDICMNKLSFVMNGGLMVFSLWSKTKRSRSCFSFLYLPTGQRSGNLQKI